MAQRTCFFGDPARAERHVRSLRRGDPGLGVAIGPGPLVHDELAAGRLVAPFGFVRGEHGYHVLARRPFEEEPRAARQLTWLRAEAVRTHRGITQRVAAT